MAVTSNSLHFSAELVHLMRCECKNANMSECTICLCSCTACALTRLTFLISEAILKLEQIATCYFLELQHPKFNNQFNILRCLKIPSFPSCYTCFLCADKASRQVHGFKHRGRVLLTPKRIPV